MTKNAEKTAADALENQRPVKVAKKKQKLSAKELRKRIFTDMPTWKSLLIMSWPAILQMLLLGSYTFVDTILAVNFASDSYSPLVINSNARVFAPEDQVRTYMTAITPITALMNAISILFSIGVSTRASINVGRGDLEKARQSIRTGTMMSTIFSFLMIPLLALTAESWIASQYPQSEIVDKISKNGYQYAIVLIGGFPIQVFWQVVSSYFRVDGRNAQVLLVAVLPIPVNLLLDWVLMGPGGMAIEGGAWATFIANVAGAALTIYFLIKYKSDTISLRIMFSFKFKMILFIGIFLAGITPFLRNLSISVTQSFEVRTAIDVSRLIYNDVETVQISSSSAFQVFAFVFPIIFAFTQSGRPIIAFNYGAKNIGRVKSTFWWMVLYSLITGLVLYALFAFVLNDYVLDLLLVKNDQIRDVTNKVVQIMLASMPLFSASVACAVLLSATDRVLSSTVVSLLRNGILIFPFMFAWKALAEANPDQEFLYWSFYPVISSVSSIIALSISIYTLRKMGIKFPPTLDERIVKYEKFLSNLSLKRREKRLLKNAFEKI